MNLFRSEEHVRQWSGFKAGTEEGIIPLLDMAKAFSGNFFRRRLDTDYVSHMREYMKEVVSALQTRGSFWQLPREKTSYDGLSVLSIEEKRAGGPKREWRGKRRRNVSGGAQQMKD